MSFTLTVTASSPPPGQCFPSTYAATVQDIAQRLQVAGLDSLNSFNFGPSTPPPDLQDRPWIKTDAQFKFLGIYTFTQGSWQPAAPVLIPGTILDFFGNGSSIVAPYYNCNGQTITGTVGGTITTPNLQGKVTLGTGTNPTTGTNFANQSTGGEEKHTQTVAELAPHTHPPLTGADFVDTGGSGGPTGTGGVPIIFEATTGSSGGGQGFNVIQPYIALYKIIFWP